MYGRAGHCGSTVTASRPRSLPPAVDTLGTVPITTADPDPAHSLICPELCSATRMRPSGRNAMAVGSESPVITASSTKPVGTDWAGAVAASSMHSPDRKRIDFIGSLGSFGSEKTPHAEPAAAAQRSLDHNARDRAPVAPARAPGPPARPRSAREARPGLRLRRVPRP